MELLFVLASTTESGEDVLWSLNNGNVRTDVLNWAVVDFILSRPRSQRIFRYLLTTVNIYPCAPHGQGILEKSRSFLPARFLLFKPYGITISDILDAVRAMKAWLRVGDR